MSKPVAVLFDFDGVIVDSLAVHLEAWDYACMKLLGTPLTTEQRQSLPGRSTHAIAAILAGNAGPKVAADLAALKKEKLREGTLVIPLLPGVKDVFSKLKSSNIPFAIASNAPRDFVHQTLDDLGLRNQVAVALGYEDAAMPKPAPDLYLLAAKKLGTSVVGHPHILVFEDSMHGLKAAEDAGMIPIGVASQHTEADLLHGSAKFACKSLADALKRGWFDALPT